MTREIKFTLSGVRGPSCHKDALDSAFLLAVPWFSIPDSFNYILLNYRRLLAALAENN